MTGRRFTGGTLVLATHNQGKVDELVALLAPFGVSVTSASDFGLDAPEETETSFVGNARLKAHHVAQATGLPALADDSGIEIDALGGAPGVYTADWAEGPGGRDFLRAMEKAWKLILESGAAPPFLARFRCALVLAWPDGHEEMFEGAAEGQLVWPLRGALGHGYDPMFQPQGHDRTFAEMSGPQKNQLSHRAAAFRQMTSECFT
jgi:XTP/dITP diphosphohydrolase